MFLHVKQSDCKAAVKVVSGIWLKVCVPSFVLEIVEYSQIQIKQKVLSAKRINYAVTDKTKTISFVADCEIKFNNMVL